MIEHHPVLNDDARRAAYADLLTLTHTTYRALMQRWGWSNGKVQRFLHAIRSAGLIHISVLPGYGLCIGVAPGSVSIPPGATPVQGRCNPGAPLSLGTRSLGKQPRFGKSNDEGVDNSLAEQLIETMNATLGRLYPEHYVPVRADNSSSHRTAAELERLEVDPGWAVQELRAQCVRFVPDKHGRGKLPGSLAYFGKGLKTAWRRSGGTEQMELTMLTVERGSGAPSGRSAETAPLRESFGNWRELLAAGDK